MEADGGLDAYAILRYFKSTDPFQTHRSKIFIWKKHVYIYLG